MKYKFFNDPSNPDVKTKNLISIVEALVIDNASTYYY